MKKVFALSLFVFIFSAFSVFSAGVTYTGQVKGIFDAKCAGCHGSGTLDYEEWKKNSKELKEKGIGMKMDTFRSLTAFVVWPNTGALMRRLDNGENTKDNKPGNMYQYLGDTKEEREKNLAVFKSWVPLWKLVRIDGLTKEEILTQNDIKNRY